MAVPGGPGAYVSTGIEHDEAGQPALRAGAAHGDDGQALPQARPARSPRGPRSRSPGPAQADVGILGWGSTEGAAHRGGRDLPRPRAEGRDLLPARAGAAAGRADPRMGRRAWTRDRRARAERDRPVRAPRALGRRASRCESVTKATGLPFTATQIADFITDGTPPGDDQRRVGPGTTKGRPELADELKVKANALKSELKPIWCPGCGDFGVLAAAYRAFAELDLDPDRTVIVSGIGCSSRFPGFVATYGFHGVHGRALPTAMGVKLANPDLNVIAVGGDGDGFAIGGGHFPHAARRNVDITYIIMNNQTYGLTKGQVSPTSLHDQKSPVDAVRQPRGADERARDGDRRRLLVRRAGRELPLEGADGADRRGHPAPGLQLHRRVQPVHRVQQHHAGVEGGGLQPARRARLVRPRRRRSRPR